MLPNLAGLRVVPTSDLDSFDDDEQQQQVATTGGNPSPPSDDEDSDDDLDVPVPLVVFLNDKSETPVRLVMALKPVLVSEAKRIYGGSGLKKADPNSFVATTFWKSSPAETGLFQAPVDRLVKYVRVAMLDKLPSVTVEGLKREVEATQQLFQLRVPSMQKPDMFLRMFLSEVALGVLEKVFPIEEASKVVEALTKAMREFLDAYLKVKANPFNPGPPPWAPAYNGLFGPSGPPAGLFGPPAPATLPHAPGGLFGAVTPVPPRVPDPPDPRAATVRQLAPRSDEIILGTEDEAIFRTDQDLMAGYALFCYKRSWDSAISYEYRGVPALRYVHKLSERGVGQKADAVDRRVPGLLMFLPMPMMRKLLAEYVQGPMPHISQADPPPTASDSYLIRPKAELYKWSSRATMRSKLETLARTMPAAGITVEPSPPAGDACSLKVVLNKGAWPDASMIILMEGLQKRSKPQGRVYPWYPAMRLLAQYFFGDQSYNTCRQVAAAVPLVQAAVGRMIAALDHLFKPVGMESEITVWRGVAERRYKWVEDAPTDEEWERRLIKTLQSTYYSTSTDRKVSTGTFLTDKGILIKLVGSCRGVIANGAMKGKWSCFKDEDEILVAPHQTYTVDPDGEREVVANVDGKTDVTTVTLRMTYAPPTTEARWVADPDDPHFELARVA